MSQELLNCQWERWGNVGTVTFDSNGITLIDNTTSTGTNWIRTEYIKLPTGGGRQFQYDFDVSITAGNRVFIQIERFDSNKNTGSNNSAIGCGLNGITPSTDIVHQRYKGIVTISDISSSQPTNYIRIRIGCGYSTTTGTFIIHSWSLKSIDSIYTNSIQKIGQLKSDSFRENYNNLASFNKNGFVEGQCFYEY